QRERGVQRTLLYASRHEALSIREYGVGCFIWCPMQMPLGNGDGSTKGERILSRSNFSSHQYSVRTRVLKSPSVPLPAGRSPACRGNWPCTPDFGKSADVDLVSSRLA